MSKQQLVSVLWDEEDTKKKTTKKQVLNKSTVHVVETEQTSPPVCTAETLPEPLAPAEETLPVPLAPTEETPCEETLAEEESPDEENTTCPICSRYTSETHCSIKHMYCEVTKKYSSDREENMVFDTYFNKWWLVIPDCNKIHDDAITEKRQ